MCYQAKLLQTIKDWKKDPIEDEWLFERFRGNQVKSMTPEEAFLSIPDTVRVLVNETDASTACEIVQTIITLARTSRTTEKPPLLIDNIENLRLQFNNYDDYTRNKLYELFRHYRL